MERKLTFAFLAVAFALSSATSGRASTIIYSNIEPGDTFGPGVAIGLEPFGGPFNYAGVGFTAGADYTFDSVEMAVSLFSGPNVLDVYLMRTAGGLPSGILESFALNNELTTDPATGMVTIDSVDHPLLTDGMEYWIVAAGGPSTTAFWAQNVHGVTGPNVSGPTLTSLERDSNSNVVMAMLVEGTVTTGTPEPGSWMLTAGALLLGLVVRQTIGHTKTDNRPHNPGIK